MRHIETRIMVVAQVEMTQKKRKKTMDIIMVARRLVVNLNEE